MTDTPVAGRWVPDEPTEAMIAAGWTANDMPLRGNLAAETWRRMLAAAPAAPAPAADAVRVTGLDFGAAIVALKDGRWVRRSGWNGKGMHVYLEDMGMSRMPRSDAKGNISYSDNGRVLPHLVLFNAQSERQPGWIASQADMLAEDWEIISWEEMR